MKFKELVSLTKQRVNDRPFIERCPGVLHGIWPAGYALVNELEKLGLSWKWIYFGVKDKQLVDMFSEQIMIDHATKLLKSELAKPGSYGSLIKTWESYNSAYHVIIDEIKSKDLAGCSDRELADIYIRFMESQIDVWAIPLTSNNISICADNVWLPAIIRKYGQKGIEEFTVLSTPAEDSMMKVEEKELLKIACDYFTDTSSQRDKLVLAKLKIHADRFHWITNNYKDVKKLDETYFLDKIESMKDPSPQLQKIDDEEKASRKKHAALLKKNIFTKEEVTQALLVAEAALLQDRRKKNNLISLYYIFEFLKEFAKRTDYTFDELCCTSYVEMKQIALCEKHKVPRSILQSRLNCCAVLIEGGPGEVLGGKEAEEIFRILDTADDVKTEMHELKGISACLGKAKGIVRVVLDVSKAKTFNDGDILIASMTRPEYTPLMRKAGAIVTNEGGISCHAAILSRELRKPCIIGTKSATKVFKDGDIVEVDADKGIVRKIK